MSQLGGPLPGKDYGKKKKKPRRDLSRRGRELAKRKGSATTWIGRDNKIIQARPGTKEKVGDHISKHRKNKNRQSLLSKAKSLGGRVLKTLSGAKKVGSYSGQKPKTKKTKSKHTLYHRKQILHHQQ